MRFLLILTIHLSQTFVFAGNRESVFTRRSGWWEEGNREIMRSRKKRLSVDNECSSPPRSRICWIYKSLGLKNWKSWKVEKVRYYIEYYPPIHEIPLGNDEDAGRYRKEEKYPRENHTIERKTMDESLPTLAGWRGVCWVEEVFLKHE